MSVGLIIAIVVVLGCATLLARLSFSIAKPVGALVVLGIIGAILTIFGIEAEIDPLDPDRDVHWMALIGTMLSFVALVGVLSLTLIWAIRRWGIKHDDNPDQGQ